MWIAAMAAGAGCTLRTEPLDEIAPDESGDPGDPAARADGGVEAAPDAADDEDATTGSIQGAVSPPQLGFGGTVNLTDQGPSGWAHWGLGGDVTAYNRTDADGPAIGDFVPLGTASLLQTNCCIGNGFSWTGGTPAASADDVIGGVYLDTANASGDGFRFSLPADRKPRTLKVYTGNWCVRASLTATLGDDSAPPHVDTSFDVPGAALENAVYSITFNAASDGQELMIDFTIAENHCTEGDVGELHLFAAAW